MLIKELIQRIQSLYSKGVQSDDTRLTNRHIYNKLLSVRSRLVFQKANKKQTISQWNYQTIPCIELIKVPPHDCPCLPPVGCDILRSKYKIPKPISNTSGELIEWVRTIEKSIKIDRISINAVNSQRGNKYASKTPKYFVENEYLYIVTSPGLKVISIRGLFEDPIEVEEFKGYCDTCIDCPNCIDYLNTEFPIDEELIEPMLELAANELVILFSRSIEDQTNNASDNIKEQSK